jgi:hypothetical protein
MARCGRQKAGYSTDEVFPPHFLEQAEAVLLQLTESKDRSIALEAERVLQLRQASQRQEKSLRARIAALEALAKKS